MRSLHETREHPLLQHFDHEKHSHLADHAQDVAEHYDAFANKLEQLLPNGHFKDEALHELLDSKDDAVRALTHK